MAILAKGIEIAVPTKADFMNAIKKPFLNPKLIITIKKPIGTDIKTAAKQENKRFLYFGSIFIKSPSTTIVQIIYKL